MNMNATSVRTSEPQTQQRSRALRLVEIRYYGLAVISVLIAVSAALFLESMNFRDAAVPLLLFAVAITSWYGRTGPAALVVVLSTVSFYWYFVEPVRTPYIYPSQIPYFIIFVAFALLISWFAKTRRRAEESIRNEADLLNLSHDSFFVMDMNGMIKYWNRGAEERYGWSAEEAVGKAVHDLLKTTFPRPLDEIKAELIRTGGWEAELVHTRKDGTQIVVASRWALERDAKGAPVAILETNNDITERKRAEDELRRSEAYLAEGQALSHTGSWSVDLATGEYEYWSDEMFRIFEIDPQRGVPIRNTLAQRIHPDDYAKVMANFEKSIRERVDTSDDYRFVLPRGAVKHVHVIRHPVLDSDGNLVKLVGTFIDITEHKRAEEALRRSQAYLTESQRMTHTGTWVDDGTIHPIYWSEELYRIFGLDPQQGVPTAENALDRIHPDDRDRFLQTFDRIIHQRIDADGEYRILLPDGTVKFLYGIGHPVLDGNGELVEIRGTAADITERKHAEEALRQSEAYLTEAQRLSQTGSWALDLATDTYVYVSEENYRIFGFDPQDGLPTREAIFQRIHPEDRNRWKASFEKSLREKVDGSDEYRIVLPDGTVKHIYTIRHAVLNAAGDLEKWVGTSLDITERKHAEEALRRSEAYLAEGQRLTHTGAWATDATPKPLYWSEELFRLYGLDPKDGVPTHEKAMQRVHPEDRDKYAQAFCRVIEQKVDSDVEFRTLLPDGAIKYLYGLGHPVLNTNGELVEVVGTTVDITERKRAEEALNRTTAYLVEAQRLTHTGAWAGDPVTTAPLYWSEEVFRLFGFDPQQGLPAWDQPLQRIHAEDRDKFWQTLQRVIHEKTTSDCEYRIMLPDGTVKHAYGTAHPFLDENGAIVELVGSTVDITERKRAEEAIRQREKQLRDVFEGIPAMAAAIRLDGSVEFTNQRWREYTGLSLEEATGSGWETAIHPQDLSTYVNMRSTSIASGKAYEGEFRLRAANGEYRWFLSRGVPLRDDRGNVVRWYSIQTDIDDRKRVEEKLQHENVALREEVDKSSMFEEIVGSSAALRAVLTRVAKVAPSDSTVLVTGETGTGKELVARAIHKRSRRSSRAFVSVNCASIPRDLIASELFGHEKGAFTGATQRHLGRFELADGGTLFLDEVGDLPAETQVALLRVLQEREFQRVGGDRPIRSDVRVIAATNRDLQAAIESGAFRSDLFYRLNVFPIETPPLRKRKEDIPLLIAYFIDRYTRKSGKAIRQINRKSLELLQSYPWPGNIRELQNVIERSVIVCESETFSVDESWLSSQPADAGSKNSVGLSQILAGEEKQAIEAALRECRGRVSGSSGAAARLGVPRSTLESRIKSLNIDKNRFKTS
jgi:PAS domain S-box-containing protein